MEDIWASVRSLLGIDADTLTLWQIVLRALIVYLAALAMVRLGDKRFLGKHTAFDVILGVILGSVVSRAITGSGSSPFFITLAAGAALVGLHWLFSSIAFRSDRFGTVVKGNVRTLIQDGEIRWDNMGRSSISRDDLLGALRANGKLSDPSEVEAAYLERSGDISVLPRTGEPKVIEISVADGVQTVRIELS